MQVKQIERTAFAIWRTFARATFPRRYNQSEDEQFRRRWARLPPRVRRAFRAEAMAAIKAAEA